MTEMDHDHRPGRRDIILKALGLVSLAGMTQASSGLALGAGNDAGVLTPELTEGPYWVDEMLDRSDLLYDPSNGTIQSGFLLLLNIQVFQVSSASVYSPLPNAYIDIWQANALGLYSDEAAQDTTGQKYLRGYQVTDSNGKVHFLTIYPGWYHGRTPHIHCRVRVYSGSVTTYNYTTQFFFDQTITNSVYATAPYNTRGTQDTYNTTDLFYTADDCMTGNEVGTESMLSLAEGAKYAVASIKVKVDLSLPTNSTC